MWERFADQGHLPCYGNISVWGSPRPQSTEFVFDPNGHGWHLDRPRYDRFLRAAAAEEGVTVREGTRVRPVGRDGGEWRLEIASGPEHASVHCAWLVDATGRGCAIARHDGARRRVADALAAMTDVTRHSSLLRYGDARYLPSKKGVGPCCHVADSSACEPSGRADHFGPRRRC